MWKKTKSKKSRVFVAFVLVDFLYFKSHLQCIVMCTRYVYSFWQNRYVNNNVLDWSRCARLYAQLILAWYMYLKPIERGEKNQILKTGLVKSMFSSLRVVFFFWIVFCFGCCLIFFFRSNFFSLLFRLVAACGFFNNKLFFYVLTRYKFI